MHDDVPLPTLADTAPIADEALTDERYRRAGRALVAKQLREFAFEELIDPEPVPGDADASDGEPRSAAADGRAEAVAVADATDPDDWRRYRVDLGPVTYRFRAQERRWDGLRLDESSVERDAGDGFEPATDPSQFVVDAEDPLGIDGLTAGHLVREYEQTLLADVHVLARDDDRDRSLLDLDYAAIDGEMTGHPWLTTNKGRIGWSYADGLAYAPERRRSTTLSWLAVDRDAATFRAVEGLDHDALVAEELGAAREVFRDRLDARGLDPDRYYFLPVHDWQWDETVVQLYGRQLAADRIVPLGEGPDEYRPLQSVRTFANREDPDKRDVKLPMRMLNTLVWRGLPGERTEAAPLVTEYVKRIRDEDPFLREECRLVLPGEVAGLNVDHPRFDALEAPPYQYRELLGAIWRESVTGLVDDGERPMTLAALLHVDSTGEPVVSQLVERSGLALEAWLDELFETTLPPLLHYLYRYGTVFSPHGENAILVLDGARPARLAVKDFVDDVNVSEHPLPELADLPDDLAAVLRTEPPEGLCWFLVYGLFVGVYRYLADLLTEHHDYPEDRFWRQVRDAVEAYQARFPELEERFELFDLFRPTYTKLCLNRNRILETGYEDAAHRPHAAEHGTVRNALYEVGRTE